MKKLKLKDLVGSLKTLEAIIQEKKLQKKGKMIALKILQYKRSSIQKKHQKEKKNSR